MIKTLSRVVVVVGLVLALGALPGLAGQPPDNDASDTEANTAGGTDALKSLTTGFSNTAWGNAALQANDAGSGNSAFGDSALDANTSGGQNTAVGASSLIANTTGSDNTAVGYFTLAESAAGSENTAVGFQALQHDTDGFDNTAVGATALSANTTGVSNTAIGTAALTSNTIGQNNTATGNGALTSNITGSFNTAAGQAALLMNQAGNSNTAIGYNALANSAGKGNIGLGKGAGQTLTAGNNNIYVGHPGATSESRTIRLGSVQTSTFVAGIAGVPVSGAPVIVSSAGQLGIQASSARYKRDIQSMGERSERLLQLRPVTFRYKQDDEGLLQYGLVAEEVAAVYPELVVRGPDGKVESVRYNELIAMLVNELQRAARAVDSLEAQLAQLKGRDADLAARLERLERSSGSPAPLARP